MSKVKQFILILITIFIFTSITFGLWDKDKPASSTSLRASNPEILANWSALEDAISQDHEFSTGGTNSGKHLQTTFDDPLSASPSTVAESEGVLYLLDVSGKAELHFEDEDEQTLQMTSAGDLFSSTGLTVTNNATFNGGATLGAGDDLIGSATSDITFNTDKFTVAGATGDTVVAGTLDVTGATEVTGIATLGDASLLKTSAAPTADAMIANKKYVDDDHPAYTGGESHIDGSGLIIKVGNDASIAANTTETVTFSATFSAAPIVIVGTIGSNINTAGMCMANTIAAGSFKVTNSAEITVGYSWIAIGY